MRNMSFAMTVPQIKDQSKTVTRRFGWWFLKPGDQICAVEKGMGLKKGEQIKRLAIIEVVGVEKQQLKDISKKDCASEGFPEYSPDEFIGMLAKNYNIAYGKIATKPVNRIEFKYVGVESAL